MYQYCDVSVLKGKTLTLARYNEPTETIFFETACGKEYKMYHAQDCCESVYLEDVGGTLSDLIGSPILEAEEVNSGDTPPPNDDYGYESYTWTFYKIGTIKGGVNLRWFGTSNGYYSEGVNFVRTA
jgi:hypothetical protein